MSEVETVLFDIGKTKEILTASVGSLSRLYPAPKTGDIVFYKEVPNADPKLPSIKVPLAKAQLPAQKPGPFLILINRNPPGAELEFSTLVIDHSLEKFPANTYRVYNYSKRRLAVRLANVNAVLNSGQSESIPYPNARKAWLKVAADEKEEGWLLVSSSPQPVGANTRTTVFLVDLKPSVLDPDPKGIMDRQMRERIYTDDAGVQHVR